MNYKQLEQKMGTQIESDWHQASGGGWIHKSAKVANENMVQGDSIVWGQVSGNAQVSDNARVFGNAQVSGDAQVLGDAWVYGDAQVFGDAWEKPVLFLLDSRGHGATNCKHGWLKIGCEEHTFADWKKRFPAIARKHNLTPEEVVEYTAIVDLFCKIGK